MSGYCSEHVLTHIRDALAQDGRVGELGLEASCFSRGGREEIVISGSVSTAERKAHVVQVVTEVVDAAGLDCLVVDDTQLARPTQPELGAAETL